MTLSGNGMFKRFGTENSRVREFLAEFMGTFFLLLTGCSANIQLVATGTTTVISTQLAWGFGFAFAVLMAASISGAHLNPAISLTATINGDLPVNRFFIYVFGQIIGAYCGTAVAYLGHLDDISMMYQSLLGTNNTQPIEQMFATFPASHMSIAGSLVDQIIGTAILSGIISMITDRRLRIPSALIPLLAGLAMSLIAMTFGANGGFAINPARDFSPRLFLLSAGYGWSIFTAGYFWIPIFGPFIGAVIGSWVYKIFIGCHGLNENLDIMMKY